MSEVEVNELKVVCLSVDFEPNAWGYSIEVVDSAAAAVDPKERRAV